MSLNPDLDPPRDFNTRIAEIRRTHASMARGYDAKADPSGLIIFRARRQRASLPWRWLIMPVIMLAGFKLLALMLIGELTYQDHIDRLASGNAAERTGAWIMQADPVTYNMAARLSAALQAR